MDGSEIKERIRVHATNNYSNVFNTLSEITADKAKYLQRAVIKSYVQINANPSSLNGFVLLEQNFQHIKEMMAEYSEESSEIQIYWGVIIDNKCRYNDS